MKANQALSCEHGAGVADSPARSRTAKIAGLFGIGCSVACAVAMILPLLGAAGAGVAAGSMAEMGGSGTSSGAYHTDLEGFLLRFGSEILLASVVLVTASLTMRRRIAGLFALGAGGLLYWGMYGQARVALMYIAIGVAYSVWAASYLWTRATVKQCDQVVDASL